MVIVRGALELFFEPSQTRKERRNGLLTLCTDLVTIVYLSISFFLVKVCWLLGLLIWSGIIFKGISYGSCAESGKLWWEILPWKTENPGLWEDFIPKLPSTSIRSICEDRLILLGGLGEEDRRFRDAWQSMDFGQTWQELPCPKWSGRRNRLGFPPKR